MFSLILIYLLLKDRLEFKEQLDFDNLEEAPTEKFINLLNTKVFVNEIFLVLGGVSFIIELIKYIS